MAPLIAPQMAPTLLLHGTSIPKVNTPNVVPAAMADNDVATWNINSMMSHMNMLDFDEKSFQFYHEKLLTSRIPPSFSTTSMKTNAKAPKTKTLPLTIAFDAFSDG